ncbi:circadian clock protein KaiC [Lichenicola sp.]|uniref:circadian clock protein KaiC n=1 Tax=Lichenicola sp. TaxID=2804529 RepID=UPI003B007D5A
MTDKRPADRAAHAPGRTIPKVVTGIAGFDEISGGGLPRGRLTAIVGAAGAGKTVFALQTIINRLTLLGEPCIFVTFEEPVSRIRDNAASFDWPADALESRLFRFVDARMPAEAVVTGAFDLEGLLAGLTALAGEIGARNIVFDGIDMLLSGLQNERLERHELLRLDSWIREAALSAIVTVKTFGAGDRDQVRADFLLYMTDCLVVLVDTVTATGASRTIRIGKYRGSGFSASPTPFVIGRSGIDVVAFKVARIGYPIFTDRISSGVMRLDALLNGGYLRGSSTLISGSPGTSKTSLAVSFIAAACARGERALLVSFDESASQIIANMRSIGIDLAPFVEAGRLSISSFLSSGRSPEEHFVEIRNLLRSAQPDCLVIDPISAFLKADYPFSSLICENLLDTAKAVGITVLCTSLLDQATGATELSSSQVSTIADTWLHVSYVARDGERNRAITIIKSRGIGHSNQVRELVLDAAGIDLVDVYVAEGEVLMGSARAQKEAEVERLEVLDQIATERQRLNLERQLAEARSEMELAVLELGWKQREADLLALAERSRREAHRVVAIERLDLRRARDDGPAADPALPQAVAKGQDDAAG